MTPMPNTPFVFLVIDSRFGVVAATLTLDDAVADMNARVLNQHDDDILGNPGSFSIKRMPFGPQAERLNQEAARRQGQTGEGAPPATETPSDEGARDHEQQLMRINAQMFEGTIRVLSIQTQNLHEQVTQLTAENERLTAEIATLRRAS